MAERARVHEMIPRHLSEPLMAATRSYPVLTVTGPRQSGKTTLVRATFPDYRYVSLEEPDVREFATEDPRSFLGQYDGGVILDEVQRVPHLFSYLQTRVDLDSRPGRYVLSGSQNFLLLDAVSQSLAGRSAIFHLLPFSHAELRGMPATTPESIGRVLPVRRAPSATGRSLEETLFSGFYPRVHDWSLDPTAWYANYYRTYVERDVRSVLNVGDLETFGRFVRLCAGRSGQLLNLSSLATDAGISHPTARRWLSVLESSFLVTLLRPHTQNFSKRLIKAPKLHFLDSGLLCYLLRVQDPEQLNQHAMRGAIFESFVVAEILKNTLHAGRESNLTFWRDSTGHEVDLLLDFGTDLVPVEVKSGRTIADDFFKNLRFFRRLLENTSAPAALVYGGGDSFVRDNVAVYGWEAW